MILAIDTATRYASIALYDDAGVIAEQSWRSANNHSVELMPAVLQMLSRQHLSIQDVTAVAVAQGPGSFTGLRIAMSTAKGLCLGLNVPLVVVPTLEITAYAAGDPGGPVLAILEAGRGRIGVAHYRFFEGVPVQQGEMLVTRAEAWHPVVEQPVLLAGEISADLAERLLAHPAAEDIAIASLAGSLRRAGYLAELAWNRLEEGRVADLDSVEPLYFHLAPAEQV
jgi:tRNA threonylcarbamoyladenosine biosynthesis protein TsaB